MGPPHGTLKLITVISSDQLSSWWSSPLSACPCTQRVYTVRVAGLSVLLWTYSRDSGGIKIGLDHRDSQIGLVDDPVRGWPVIVSSVPAYVSH
jgi:hypothetical protein